MPAGGRGTGTVTHEIPTDVTISAAMENRGLLVLADNWDVGWQAYIDGIKTRILRTDHALRGVVVPSGNHTIEFRFEPASMQLGLWVSGVAVASVAAWSMMILIRRQRLRSHTPIDTISTWLNAAASATAHSPVRNSCGKVFWLRLWSSALSGSR